jgi:hypothetical protein
VTANNQPTLTGAATAGSLVTVYIDGTAVGTTTADGSGAWQYNVATPLQDGPHTVAPPRQIPQVTSVRRPRPDLYGGHRRPGVPTGIALTAATDTGASASDGVTANNQPTLTARPPRAAW